MWWRCGVLEKFPGTMEFLQSLRRGKQPASAGPVFLVFLPPVLWAAAYFTSWREYRNNLRPISLLAVGLVLATPASSRRLRYEAITAGRVALIVLRNDGTISDEVLHRLEHELDVEALRLGYGEHRVSPR